MFERAKFMVKFAGAYRRSRSDGGGHEAALQAAADDMFRPVTADFDLPGDELDAVSAAHDAIGRAVDRATPVPRATP